MLQIGQDSSIYILDIILGWVYDVISHLIYYFTQFSNLNTCISWTNAGILQTVNNIFTLS